MITTTISIVALDTIINRCSEVCDELEKDQKRTVNAHVAKALGAAREIQITLANVLGNRDLRYSK